MKFINKLRKLFVTSRKSKIDYHASIHTLPVWNTFEIRKTNDYKYLYFDYENKTAPEYFKHVYYEMIFEFEHLKVEMFELMFLKELYKGKYLVEKKPIYNTLSKEIELKIQHKITEYENQKDMTLNEFINYIELTFNIVGTIDPKKMSTSRAYSLYNQAKEINEAKLKQHATAKA